MRYPKLYFCGVSASDILKASKGDIKLSSEVPVRNVLNSDAAFSGYYQMYYAALKTFRGSLSHCAQQPQL